MNPTIGGADGFVNTGTDKDSTGFRGKGLPSPQGFVYGGSPSITRGHIVRVIVRDGKVEQALRKLKRDMQREGIFREAKRHEFFEKPSEVRKRKEAEALRRHRKELRKREDVDHGRNPKAKSKATAR